MHLSAMPTGKSDLSTHLGITIRWSALPGSYLPVATGGRTADHWPGASGTDASAAAGARLCRGGDAAC